MDEIDRYLNEVCWAMGGRFAEQQAARDELRGHIDEAVRDLEAQGVRRDEALARALRDLGDATEVGRGLRASRGRAPLRRPLAQPAGAVAIGRRRSQRLPHVALLLATGAAALAWAGGMLYYLWPG